MSKMIQNGGQKNEKKYKTESKINLHPVPPPMLWSIKSDIINISILRLYHRYWLSCLGVVLVVELFVNCFSS